MKMHTINGFIMLSKIIKISEISINILYLYFVLLNIKKKKSYFKHVQKCYKFLHYNKLLLIPSEER